MPELKFPVLCHLKIFALAEAELEAPVGRLLADHGCPGQATAGSSSSGGKYRTWNLSVTFRDRAHMDALTQALAALPGVKMVL